MEVYHNSEWGTVCDDGWDLNDAKVVCSELDFGPAIAARYNAFYGQGGGQVWLGNLTCDGTERNIRRCSHSGWGVKNCSHSKDAGIQCSVPGSVYSKFSIMIYATSLSILHTVHCSYSRYILYICM